MNAEILSEDNILLNVKPESKTEAIERAGRLLVQNGYVEVGYIEGMHKREAQITTYGGNGVAIPHGMNEYIKYIRQSGIVVIQYPEGVDFGSGNTAYIVIGIAGKGEEHMDILSKIAVTCLEEENVQKLVKAASKREIIEMLMGNEG
ncbi:MAG: PTS sugar transporter subunit IIA [Bacillota bacterium]|nr:PTS sugar transporter subunit IIA [Bacillota bacterium]